MRVGVLLDGRAHDVRDTAVVSQVHHLGPARLQQAANHVDGRIVAIEQAKRRRRNAAAAAPPPRHCAAEARPL